MRKVLSVTKQELTRREAEAQKQRKPRAMSKRPAERPTGARIPFLCGLCLRSKYLLCDDWVRAVAYLASSAMNAHRPDNTTSKAPSSHAPWFPRQFGLRIHT